MAGFKYLIFLVLLPEWNHVNNVNVKDKKQLYVHSFVLKKNLNSLHICLFFRPFKMQTSMLRISVVRTPRFATQVKRYLWSIPKNRVFIMSGKQIKYSCKIMERINTSKSIRNILLVCVTSSSLYIPLYWHVYSWICECKEA